VKSSLGFMASSTGTNFGIAHRVVTSCARQRTTFSERRLGKRPLTILESVVFLRAFFRNRLKGSTHECTLMATNSWQPIRANSCGFVGKNSHSIWLRLRRGRKSVVKRIGGSGWLRRKTTGFAACVGQLEIGNLNSKTPPPGW
ncbi:MAG: hypothetical protein PHE83_08305, partial [Opitutaceae bacterium]|nr:hypothetical protein [Opitutaceae bacterium]